MQNLHDTDKPTKMVRYYMPNMVGLQLDYNQVKW